MAQLASWRQARFQLKLKCKLGPSVAIIPYNDFTKTLCLIEVWHLDIVIVHFSMSPSMLKIKHDSSISNLIHSLLIFFAMFSPKVNISLYIKAYCESHFWLNILCLFSPAKLIWESVDMKWGQLLPKLKLPHYSINKYRVIWSDWKKVWAYYSE